MIFNMLYLANQGVDIVRLDAVPYIWKQLGTNCRNPATGSHHRSYHAYDLWDRMPWRSSSRRSCHGSEKLFHISELSKNQNVICCTTLRLWQAHGTQLQQKMSPCFAVSWISSPNFREIMYSRELSALPWRYWMGTGLWISWKLRYSEVPHKKYLNDFLTGKYPDSFARGELYNDDPRLGDLGFLRNNNFSLVLSVLDLKEIRKVCRAVRYDITLHAFMLSPVRYPGNLQRRRDWSGEWLFLQKMIRKNPMIHVIFTEENSDWKLAENRHDPATVQGKLFPVLDKLEHIPFQTGIFNSNVPIHTIDTWDNSILAFVRENDEEKIYRNLQFQRKW